MIASNTLSKSVDASRQIPTPHIAISANLLCQGADVSLILFWVCVCRCIVAGSAHCGPRGRNSVGQWHKTHPRSCWHPARGFERWSFFRRLISCFMTPLRFLITWTYQEHLNSLLYYQNIFMFFLLVFRQLNNSFFSVMTRVTIAYLSCNAVIREESVRQSVGRCAINCYDRH